MLLWHFLWCFLADCINLGRMEEIAGRQLTLTVDCGGGGIKASVVDQRGNMVATPQRVVTPYPLPPDLLVQIVQNFQQQMPTANRITVGMPGMIRHGIVVSTPHYVCKYGPRTRVLPELVDQWSHFDLQRYLTQQTGLPSLVLNDAEVAGAGVISGTGLEMVITLGTGLGNSIWDAGYLAPHLELSHLTARWGLLFDDYISEPERRRMGDAHWSKRVRRVVAVLRETVMWDRLYIGGGNSSHITESVRQTIGAEVILVPNDSGIRGGVRAWELMGHRLPR